MTVTGTRTATLLPTVIDPANMAGNTGHYRLEPPYVGKDVDTDEEVTAEYVVVSDIERPDDSLWLAMASLFGATPEKLSTAIFVAEPDGMHDVMTIDDMPACIFEGDGYRDQVRALSALGYEIA